MINSSPVVPLLLEVRRLSVAYHAAGGVIRAARDVSFEIAGGEILALVGETGCGKSTVASCLLGLLDPHRTSQQGEISLSGRPLPTRSDEKAWRSIRGRSIGMVFQDPRGSLNPVLPIGAQLADVIRANTGTPKRECLRRAAELLASVGLAEAGFWMQRYPYELSGGMCQRVAIALAISGNPTLLVADEPTSALDPTIQAQILTLIRGMNRSGLTVFLISHNLELVAHYATCVAVMYAGRIVESGPAREILENPLHPYTHGLLRANPGLLPPGKRLESIAGIPPGGASELPGCSFAPRCARAERGCAAAVPSTHEAAPGHRVACFKPGGG